MILTGDNYVMQNDIVYNRRNSIKDKVLYTFLAYCENEFADDYGEWFNVRMSELQEVIEQESVNTVMICLNRLRFHGYIALKYYKSSNPEIVQVRLLTLEEREENGLRP